MFIKTQYGMIINTDWVHGFYVYQDNYSGKYQIKICTDDDIHLNSVIAEYDSSKEAWDNMNRFYTMLSYQIPSYSFRKEGNRNENV